MENQLTPPVLVLCVWRECLCCDMLHQRSSRLSSCGVQPIITCTDCYSETSRFDCSDLVRGLDCDEVTPQSILADGSALKLMDCIFPRPNKSLDVEVGAPTTSQRLADPSEEEIIRPERLREAAK